MWNPPGTGSPARVSLANDIPLPPTFSSVALGSESFKTRVDMVSSKLLMLLLPLPDHRVYTVWGRPASKIDLISLHTVQEQTESFIQHFGGSASWARGKHHRRQRR